MLVRAQKETGTHGGQRRQCSAAPPPGPTSLTCHPKRAEPAGSRSARLTTTLLLMPRPLWPLSTLAACCRLVSPPHHLLRTTVTVAAPASSSRLLNNARGTRPLPALRRLMTSAPAFETAPPPATPDEVAAVELAAVESRYRPFLAKAAGETEADDWTSTLELDTVREMVEAIGPDGPQLRILVLYGSLRERYVISCRRPEGRAKLTLKTVADHSRA